MMFIVRDIVKLKKLLELSKNDDILKTYISDNDFKPTNDGNNIECNSYVFDRGYQKNFESAEPIKVEFNFDGVIPAGINGYVLALTNK